MVNAAKILELLNSQNIGEAIRLLKQDIESTSTTSKNTYKARVKLSQMAQKDMKTRNEKLAGAWTDTQNNKQVICNGYWLAVYNDIKSGLAEPDAQYLVNGQNPIDYKKLIPAAVNQHYTKIKYNNSIDLPKIAAQKKICKAEKKTLFCKFGTTFLDSDLVLKVLATFENPSIFIEMGKPTTPLYLRADNGEGLILPLKINEGINPETTSIIEFLE